MIGHTALGKVIGSDLFRTVSGSDLALAQFRFRVMGLLLFDIVQLGAEKRKGFCLVLKL